MRSFGTEDRPTDRPVPARDEIFEYIIFRGADIEDLQVREPPQSSLAQDPAIVESSMQPAGGARSTAMGTGNNLGGKGLKSSSNNDPLRQLNLNQQHSSRPFSQQSAAGQVDGQEYSYGNQRRSNRQQPPQQQQEYYNDFSGNNRRGNQKYGYSEWTRGNNAGWDNGYRQQQQQQQQQQPAQRYARQQQNYDANRFYPSRRPNNGGQQSNNQYSYRERRNSTGGITGTQPNPSRPNRQQRERTNSIRGNSDSRSTLKFIGDFDFEKSNAEFDKNAIEEEIKKSLSIKPTKENDDDSSNVDKEKEAGKENEHDNEQEPTEASLSKLDQPQPEVNPDGYYDKQKSFFDRISCETTEKEKTYVRSSWRCLMQITFVRSFVLSFVEMHVAIGTKNVASMLKPSA